MEASNNWIACADALPCFSYCLASMLVRQYGEMNEVRWKYLTVVRLIFLINYSIQVGFIEFETWSEGSRCYN